MVVKNLIIALAASLVIIFLSITAYCMVKGKSKMEFRKMILETLKGIGIAIFLIVCAEEIAFMLITSFR